MYRRQPLPPTSRPPPLAVTVDFPYHNDYPLDGRKVRSSSRSTKLPTHQHILSIPVGARWLKVDLHVHTPGSDDICDEDKNASPEDVVRIALQKGLDIIAIADHNTTAWCDKIRQAAAGTTLTVFPGVEISSHQGHVIAIFDVDVPAYTIEDLLVKLDFQRAEFGSLHAATSQGIFEVCQAVAEAGGIAIAAHADAVRGFLSAIPVGAERKRAYNAPDLWALDIVYPASRQYQTGSVSDYPRSLACIQSSDSWIRGAHRLDGMAQRHCLLKMDQRSLSGLKLALIDPQMRVRFPEDQSFYPANTILGMWVTGGFLDGQQFRFNENVTCLIGDTGAGKSVAIELLRFALDQQARVPKILSEVNSLLQTQLGNLGTVHVLLKKGDTQYLVERARGTPEASPTVQRLNGDTLEPLLGELQMPLFFPIKGFSQSEIIEFARDPEVRLSLTDDLIDCTAEEAAITDLKVTLRTNAGQILGESTKAKKIRDQLAELSTLIEARNEIDRVLTDSRIKLHQRWYEERTLISSASRELSSLADASDRAKSLLQMIPSWPADLSALPNPDLLAELQSIYGDWQKHLDTLEKTTAEKLLDMGRSLSALSGKWQTRFDKAEEEYRTLLQTLDKDGVGLQALSERRTALDQQIISLQARERELKERVIPGINRLQDDREELLTELQRNRRAITAKREAKTKDLNAKLHNRIRLDVRARAMTGPFRQSLQDIAKGSYLQAADLDLLAKCHPVALVKLLFSREFAALSEKSGVDETKLQKLWDTLLDRDRLEDLYTLQLYDIDDIIEVKLDVGSGTYRPLESLAHGQKCMVVLMVALAEGESPLLVDQPEDALHAPGIEEGIVSTLRSRRGTRQCLFATRSANILVSADAEQIIALKADAQHGEVVGTGSLDRFTQRQLVIYHVEGGDEAFRRRRTKYALRPTS